MGTQVRKAAGIPTALVPHVWRCGQNSDPFDQTQLTGAVFPAVLSEATPYATVTMEMQRLFAGDCNRRPAAIAAAITDDIYGAGWQDWVPFGVWLCEEYPLLLRSARVQGRRDQCRLAAEVVREAVVWGVIKDPLSDGSDALTFVNAPPLLISTQPQSSDEEEMGSSDDEVSDAEDEAPFLFGGVTPLTADRTPYKDMRCPDCGSTNAVARDFQCHVRAKGVTGRAGNSLVDDRIRAMIALMHQHFVSQVQMQPLAEGIAKLLGRTLHQFPKRSTAQVILKETGVGAKAELCAQLLEWMDECGPQMMSVCLDAASIGEDKYEGISFCRKVVAEPFNPRRPHVYRRLALGLVDLVNGTDDHKFAKVLELMSDYIKC